jgi:cephalosporin-C deacetylase
MTSRLLLSMLALLALASTLAAQAPKPPPSFIVKADRADATYKQGEPVNFVIEVAPNSFVPRDADVTWIINKDGVPPVAPGKGKLVDGKIIATAKLDEPGFLLCRAAYTDAQKKTVSALGGAAVDPLLIKPSMPVPDDFEAFWKAQKEKLAAVPMKAKMTPAVVTSTKAEAFDVQVDALGAPASGYFARPIGAQPKSLPILLMVHGAGVVSGNLANAVTWAENGALVMNLNAHGIANGQPPEYYKELAEGTLKDYRTAGRESRDTIYFLGMFLREVRALDFLCAQPEWDGKTVVVYGSSQGGFQGFAAAGIDDRVSYFAAGVPAGCDHSGVVKGRVNGWPKFVPTLPDGKPDAKVIEATRYFDNVNFAARTKAKGAFVTVGFIDTTCPPTTVYAAYNALPILKGIYNDIPSGHANSPEATSAMVEAVKLHFKEMKAK